MLRKKPNLSETETEIFEFMAGLANEEKRYRKKQASKRALRARRAIEKRREEKELSSYVDECWFNG